ncbi:MAG: hypothetical protein EXS29_07195 [Pedosphaera sp.]|nr:hypothetical protein [Pedosphaera sp.]
MNTQSIVVRIEQSLLAWKTHVPQNKYLGLTWEEAVVVLASPKAIRGEIAAADSAYTGLLATRTDLDSSATSLLKRLTYAVLAEQGGENSPMYRAMGYVTEEERASGLTRKSDGVSTDSTPPDVSQAA